MDFKQNRTQQQTYSAEDPNSNSRTDRVISFPSCHTTLICDVCDSGEMAEMGEFWLYAHTELFSILLVVFLKNCPGV